MQRKLLEGVRVCDFTRVIVGPLTTKTLTEWGAQVIKIEGRSNLGVFRIQAPNPDLSAQHNQWNSGKLGITLSLNTEKGREIALKIAAWADIVIENFAGGVMEKLGLSYEDIKKVNPDIIMLSSCMQGQTGPFARHPGWGFQLSALSGFSNITGWDDRPPPDIGVYTDFITPQYNICLLIGALLYRKRTGKGMYIDTAQFETGLHFLSPVLLDYFVNGRVANRMGNKSDLAAPHAAYRCMDEYRKCVIPLDTDEKWAGLCRVSGNEKWLEDARFSTPELRIKNKAVLQKLIETWSSALTVEDVVSKTQSAGIDSIRLIEKDPPERHENACVCLPEKRWCTIAVTTDEEWQAFRAVIGNPDWSGEARFATLAGRKEHEDDLDRLVEEWTIQHTAFDVMNLMQNGGVPAGVVETGEDQLEHDLQTRHRGLFKNVEHPYMGTLRVISPPFKMSKVECQVERGPLLGEHTEYVLKDILGYSDEDVVNFLLDGVLE